MKISLLQPEIVRGDIEYNSNRVQGLIDRSYGDLLILPEYILTGSLVLDKEADVHRWAEQSERAKRKLCIPEGKTVLLDTLVERGGRLFNACELLPGAEWQAKVHPDDTEAGVGICAGEKHGVFVRNGKKFKVVICTDFRYQDEIQTKHADFMVWISHFSENTYERAVSEMRRFVERAGIPIFASSPVSDKNIGRSTYVSCEGLVSLSGGEGIMEIELD